MKLLVTGASGFLGKYVVAEALSRGHSVRAMVRPGVDVGELPWDGHERLDYARVDLRSRRGLADAIAGVDAVLHVAAKTSGDVYAQMEGTVVATENLLVAMQDAGINRLILVSSFSVYEYLHRWSFATVNERSPLESRPLDRDAYTFSKLAQEQLARRFSDEHNWKLTVLRPGVIFGPGKTVNARLGMQTKDFWFTFTGWARVPLTYVEHCALAIVLAAETDAAAGETINVVDDNPPTQWGYISRVSKYLYPRPVPVPVPWMMLRALARTAVWTNRLVFKDKARLPSILVPCRQHARFKPLRYPNTRLRDVLGWTPRYTLEQALALCYGERPDAPDSGHSA